MTMQVRIKDQYIDRFVSFIHSLPQDAISVDKIEDNSISFQEAQNKVQKAINNISLNQGIDLDSAFEKVNQL